MFAEDKPVVSADKTCVVSADKTSVVSADKTSVASADEKSVVCQDIPMVLWTQGGGRFAAAPHLYCCCDISRAYPYISFCVACVCCALLCGVRVLCSFVSCKRQTGQRTCRQAPSQEIRQAISFADRGTLPPAARFRVVQVPYFGRKSVN